MLNDTSEKNIHIRISQLNDYANVIADLVEASKLIPNFKENLKNSYEQRVRATYNLQGKAVLNLYNL